LKIKDESKIVLDFVGHTDFAAAVREIYHSPCAARLAAYFEYFRSQNPDGFVLLDAGDVLVAAPIINLSDGTPVMEVVNLFGYDTMTLGNHEFDHGREAMQKILSMASFPLLCANVIEKSTGKLLPYVKPYVILEKRGLKIGVLGVTTEYTPFMVKKEAFEPFEVTSVVEACNRYIPEMKAKGADVIVVLGHLPGNIDLDGQFTGEMAKIAETMEEIDILFGGHNPGDIAIMVGNTVCSKTGFSAQSIGHIKIAFDPATRQIECLVNEIVPVLNGNLEIEPDLKISREVDRILEPYLRTLDEVIGEAEDDLIVSTSAECSLGNFFTDCMREACNTRIGLFNSTSCFGYIPKGPITSEMIMWVMCFNDNLFKGAMTGKQIREMVERTYESKHLGLNGTLQVSGLKIVIDSNKPDGQKVQSISTSDGTLLRDAEHYWVATSAYIASGGNDYRDITSLTNWEKTDFMSHPVFIEKMRLRRRLSSRTEGRIIDLARQ